HETRSGKAVAVYVQGRSGMGKTMLVRNFLDQLIESEPNAVVLSGRCYKQESVPYKALDSIVDALSRYLSQIPPLQAEAVLPIDVLLLARLFPVLRQVEVVAKARRKAPSIPDSKELRRRAFSALRELFTRLTDKNPLVLFIDDLQWGDLDSASLLGEILRPPDPPPLLLIGSYRSEEADISPFLKAFRSSNALSGMAAEAREMIVGELSPLDSEQLALILSSSDHPISSARAQAIARESGGNPFFISQLVRYSNSASESTQGGYCPIEVTLGEVISARVSQLPETARRLLEVVSASGCPLEHSVIRRAVKFDIDENKTLAVLQSAHMIRITGT